MWFSLFPCRFNIFLSTHGQPSAASQLYSGDSFSLEKLFFFSRLIKKINKLPPPSLLSRSSVSAFKTLGLHCPALCNIPSNQILYVNWTIAANRFRSEWKGFSPWILISNPQAESRNIKFPRLSSECKGEKTLYIYFPTIFKRIHALKGKHDKRSVVLEDIKL